MKSVEWMSMRERVQGMSQRPVEGSSAVYMQNGKSRAKDVRKTNKKESLPTASANRNPLLDRRLLKLVKSTSTPGPTRSSTPTPNTTLAPPPNLLLLLLTTLISARRIIKHSRSTSTHRRPTSPLHGLEDDRFHRPFGIPPRTRPRPSLPPPGSRVALLDRRWRGRSFPFLPSSRIG